MRWRKWWRRRIAFLTALMLIVATVHPVFASDEWTDEFEGWTDNAKEETYLSYEITDWLALSSDLVTDANTVGVSVKAINLSNKVNKLRSKVKKAIKPLSYGVIHDKDYYVELMLAIIQAVSNGKPSGNDPCMYQTYVDPFYSESQAMTFDKSVQLTYNRLLQMENAYRSKHKKDPLFTKNDGKYSSVLAGLMLGEGYVKANKTYKKSSAKDYVLNNEEKFIRTSATGEEKTIIPIVNLPDLVQSYFHVITVEAGGSLGYGNGGLDIPIIYQGDYAKVSWGSSNIKDAGCGVCSLAMVLTYLTGRTVTVQELVSKYNSNTYRLSGGATKGASMFPAAAKAYGVTFVKHTSSASEAIKALKNGQPVICSQKKGLFTGGLHFIVLRGINAEGKVLVNDPNGRRRSEIYFGRRDPQAWLNKGFDFYKDIHATLNSGYYIFGKKK